MKYEDRRRPIKDFLLCPTCGAPAGKHCRIHTGTTPPFEILVDWVCPGRPVKK